jgi:hypothetical protein
MSTTQSVQCFGKKKTATAVAHCKQGKGLVKVNGKPLSLVEPQILRFKVYEPILILGPDKFGMSDLKLQYENMEMGRTEEVDNGDGQRVYEEWKYTGVGRRPGAG